MRSNYLVVKRTHDAHIRSVPLVNMVVKRSGVLDIDRERERERERERAGGEPSGI